MRGSAPVPSATSAAAAVHLLAVIEARGVTGAARTLLDFAALAPGQTPGIRVELATYWRAEAPGHPGRGTRDIQELIDAAAAEGVHTHVIHERHVGDPRLLPGVRALLLRTRADIVETHNVKSHFLVASAGVPAPSRWVAFHHGYTTTDLKTRALNQLDRWSLARAAAVVTTCEAFAADLCRTGIPPSRVHVVHSSVRPDGGCSTAAADVRRDYRLPAGARIILVVGRLSREKGHSQIFAALAQPALSRAGGPVLLIAGDGPERSRLERLARELGIGDRVRFAGHRRNIWPCYHAADVVALPSDSEGSPLALLEAMAAARPVVATRVGGVPEIITDGSDGLLVPRRDPAALAQALGAILADPSRAAALGHRAAAVAAVRFSPEARAARLAALYGTVCA